MRFAFDPPPPVALPVAGIDAVFPVHRIYCVARNYADHAREMGGNPDRELPFFFQKNPDNLVTDGRFPYPPASSDVQFEIELAVGLRVGGRDIPPDAALDCIYGYAVALDMTRRDLQAEAKRLGRPWEVAKAFEKSCPCSPLVPASRIGHPKAGPIRLDVNGQRRQVGDLSHMIWDVPHLISQLSKLFELVAGDLILTGTPAGVAAVQVGDRLEGYVEGVGKLVVEVV